MTVNYIYDTNGQIEYAVIPFNIWNSVKEFAVDLEKKNEGKKKFEPSEYAGMLSHYNFDLEAELQEMKNQWTKNLL